MNPSASAPAPMSYPNGGVIAASMMVRLYSGLGENGTIYYTTDGEEPTTESKRYTALLTRTLSRTLTLTLALTLPLP